jgi:hypothetical protein
MFNSLLLLQNHPISTVPCCLKGGKINLPLKNEVAVQDPTAPVRSSLTGAELNHELSDLMNILQIRGRLEEVILIRPQERDFNLNKCDVSTGPPSRVSENQLEPLIEDGGECGGHVARRKNAACRNCLDPHISKLKKMDNLHHSETLKIVYHIKEVTVPYVPS